MEGIYTNHKWICLVCNQKENLTYNFEVCYFFLDGLEGHDGHGVRSNLKKYPKRLKQWHQIAELSSEKDCKQRIQKIMNFFLNFWY